jgi:hypothetical protein
MSYKDDDRHRCRQREFDAPEHVKCEQYDGYTDDDGEYHESFMSNLARHACKQCKKNHYTDMWGSYSSDDYY